MAPVALAHVAEFARRTVARREAERRSFPVDAFGIARPDWPHVWMPVTYLNSG